MYWFLGFVVYTVALLFVGKKWGQRLQDDARREFGAMEVRLADLLRKVENVAAEERQRLIAEAVAGIKAFREKHGL